MKRIIFFCAAVFALSACSNNDDLSVMVSEETRTSFQQMYPGAKGVGWEKRGIYKVAMFSYNGSPLTAWYNQDGAWCMTEQRMDLDAAPVRVATAYRSAAANYNDANYVDKLSRDGIEDVYVVVEGSGINMKEYYFSADGIAVKTLDHNSRTYEDYRNEIVPQITASVYATTRSLYTGARVMEVDVLFPGVLYITIIHQSDVKTLEFSLTGAWSMSTWAVTENYVMNNCPEVYETYAAFDYTDSCRIVSIDYYESSSLAYYWFVLNDKGKNVDLKISDAGNVIVTK